MAATDIITPKYLHEALDYDPDTGALTWKKRPESHFQNTHAQHAWNTRFAGKTAGWTTDQGYEAVYICGRKYKSHRIIWVMSFGYFPVVIDHINGDRSDNRMCNLRVATRAENQHNRRTPKSNKSGFKGVLWVESQMKWRARIKTNGQLVHLGYFKKKEEAYAVYCAAAKNLHGEFARL